jgi:hypothetical protein
MVNERLRCIDCLKSYILPRSTSVPSPKIHKHQKGEEQIQKSTLLEDGYTDAFNVYISGSANDQWSTVTEHSSVPF